MMKLFDYVYYRMYLFFLIRKDNVPETTGWILLSLLHFFSLLTMVSIIRFILEFPLPHKFYIIPLAILIGTLNWYRYERNFEIKSFDEQWKDEKPSDKKRKGYLIAIYTAFVVLFPMVIGYLKYNHSLL